MSLLTWHDGLQACMALGRVLVAVAVSAHQHVVFGGKRPIHQRALTLGTEEAVTVPVALLVRQILQSQSEMGDDHMQTLICCKVNSRKQLSLTLLVHPISCLQSSQLLEKTAS